MTIEWLAGNRLRGTTAERPEFGLPSGSVGGWVELGRTTLGSAGDTIPVASLTDKRYYMVLLNNLPTGTTDANIRLNTDTGTNYAYRYSIDGAADGSNTSRTAGLVSAGGSTTTPEFAVSYFANLNTKEKLWISHLVEQKTAGAGTAPRRIETVSKHAQTTNPISTIDVINGGAGSFNTGSEVVVLGWDPADTHTTNFWEELASVNASGSTTSFDTGTFTAKKYLWIQYYAKATGNATLRMGNGSIDTGTNYALRTSTNGASDATAGSYAGMLQNTTNGGSFGNVFIVNNSSNEKLGIGHFNYVSTAGAGTSTSRQEQVGKWTNTSNQINIIQLNNNGGGATNYTSDSIIKVWGSD